MKTGLISKNIPDVPFSQRAVVLILVLAVHSVAFLIWTMMPVQVNNQPKSIRAYVLLETESPQRRVQPSSVQKKSQPVPPSKIELIETAAILSLPSDENNVTLPAVVTSPESVVSFSDSAQPTTIVPIRADSEPSYQAEGLKNLPPSYPMVARRMGWEGKVILSVEVLENGTPDEVKVLSSSNYALLDKAAVRAVKRWRFIAAQRTGNPVTQWLQIPINFVLKQNSV